MPQIRLYDSNTGELAPIAYGDAIRVEVHIADLATQGLVDVASTRPFVLFSLLQRLLQHEGLPAKFLFNSPGASDVLRELDLDADQLELDESSFDLDDLLCAELESASFADDGEDDDDDDDDEEEGPEEYVGRCVDIRFGAAREGEEWAGDESAGGMTLNEAMRRFGHRALVFYLMGTHYSQPLGDPIAGMSQAAMHVQRLRDTLARLRPDEPSPPEMRHHVEAFHEALATDLDTPLAFVALFQWVLEAEQRKGDVGDRDLRAMLELLELDDRLPMEAEPDR